ncbi:response regulator transcription factor [Novosphingobium huizhouense]|uniref:response regulator transcription factor n=1 Tax=Novosphingobium huizhouense TaxID=2866625 RepID=UPI001CD8A76D|nr:response regulator transcription factor [Novosphingobium huizhouense]
MVRKPVVLLQEADVTRRRMMEFNLEVEGFAVVAPRDLPELERRVCDADIDLAVLNWDGADRQVLNALQALKSAQAARYVPLLVIGGPVSEEDRLVAYEAGVDDIMVSPFSVAELLARIRAILRRTSPELGGRIVRAAGLALDVDSGRVTRDGKDVRLSQTEFRILQYLMEHVGKVRTREQIRAAVWEKPGQVEIRAIDVRITRLRRQLRIAGGSELIRTIRSIGYVLTDEQPRVQWERAAADAVLSGV